MPEKRTGVFTIRYTRWDHRATSRLRESDVFEGLTARLFDSSSVEEAMDALIRKGMERHGVHVAGADEIAMEIRRRIEEIRSSFELATPTRAETITGLQRIERMISQSDLASWDVDQVLACLPASLAEKVKELVSMMALLSDSGYLVPKDGRIRLSPKGIRRVGEQALREIFQTLDIGRRGEHPGKRKDFRDLPAYASMPYRQGEELHLDLIATLRNAVLRSPHLPLGLEPHDFEVLSRETATRACTVLLMDMSWSMSWEGRFAAAKKIALALETLIRTRYPRDYLGLVGFFSRAIELTPGDLPEASWNMLEPFTNLQDGLRLASTLLGRNRGAHPQIIVVTDGQPTAYYRSGALHCEWPASFGGICKQAEEETLKEVERLTRRGIAINTFMLDDNSNLRGFVERLTRVNSGRAFFTRPDRLGEYLMIDYVLRRRRRI